MKGMSLPTDTIVYLIIGVVVLGVIIVLIVYFNQSREPIDYQVAYNTLCLKLLMKSDCATADLDTIEMTIQGNTITLQETCDQLGIDDTTCRENCGCEMEE